MIKRLFATPCSTLQTFIVTYVNVCCAYFVNIARPVLCSPAAVNNTAKCYLQTL